MGIAAITPLLFFAAIARTRSESSGSYHQNSHRGESTFGDLLKPPPLPLSNIAPVPFHSSASDSERNQRQHTNLGYDYQLPPPPPPAPLPVTSNFNFPTPFYKQYNFNFVPPPQPFSTPSSPSLFQKVSNWLFPSAQPIQAGESSYETNHLGPAKKDCNPCNIVPWIPVIKYNAQRSNLGSNPTYGPPNPNSIVRNNPEPFQYSQSFAPSSLHDLNFQSNKQTFGTPHEKYGPPSASGSIRPPASTYGPPSPTHSISEVLQASPSSTSTFDPILSTHNNPSIYNNVNLNSNGKPGNNYVTTHTNEVEIIKSNTAENEFHLPKVYYPNRFKNSLGDSVSNKYSTNIPATAVAASKVKTELGHFVNITDPNASLSKPTPFTSNRGRNIHTLQPVALPNLSISPLPPIFNARPFQNFPPPINAHNIHTINNLRIPTNEINVVKSVPVAEFTHSIEYPATIIQSPIVDLDIQKGYNQSKSYRNIPNVYLEEESKDVSSQASEDHISATKTEIPHNNFRNTGTDTENDVNNKILLSYSKSHLKAIPNNHRPHFEDSRGVADNALHKYRTENTLKEIDSHLLYLKPNVPHKEYDNFLPTPVPNTSDYEIYDDIPTTTLSPSSTVSEVWDKYKSDHYSDVLPPTSLTKENSKNPKIVQIIIPYTTNQNSANNLNNVNTIEEWRMETVNENQARKIPLYTENNLFNTMTEQEYNTQTTNIREITASVTEQTGHPQLNNQAVLNDLFDIKEQPFDIIKLQNNIDGWTEQEFSKHAQNSEESIGKYAHAKQIPDEFFTTISPVSNYPTTTEPDYNYFYDHEGSSSMQHSVLKSLPDLTTVKSKKEYNTITRSKEKTTSDTKDKKTTNKNISSEENLGPHIFTAASAFRTTSTTIAPWEKIQTSISPLTKEKVYVVTSKPWRDITITNKTWQEGFLFESKRTTALDNTVSGSDNLPFKSPRFSNRPSIAPSSRGNVESSKQDPSFAFSKTWHQSINELEAEAVNVRNHTGPSESPQDGINTDEE